MLSKIRLIPLLLVAVLFAAACSDNNVLDLTTGDCFNDPADGSQEIANVEMVDCNEPHDNEAFHVFQIDALGTQSEYEAACIEAFEAYVGIDYLDSEIFVGNVSPTPDSFSDGDRDVVCIGFLLGEQLTETIKGSMR